MAKRLRSFVHLADERGEVHSFGPDDKVPAWAAKVMGDHVWADDDEEDGAEVGAVTVVQDEAVPADEKSEGTRRRGTAH